MTKVIGVRFRNVGKQYYFNPAGLDFKRGDRVIVETARGVECGFVSSGGHEVEDDRVVQPLKDIMRRATDSDVAQYEANLLKEREAYAVCMQKIRDHKLDMKLVDVEYTFDGQKILFYFTADGRVDFRELVKDLAGVFRTRIELRQIGVRDESKLLGGIGICGKPFCCSTFLFEFQPVSIKMAKEQGKSLNPTKISGVCGRLMCCLKFEQNVYDELIRLTPRNGAVVKTDEGRGIVIESNVLGRTVKVRMEDNPEATRVCKIDEIQVLSNGKGRAKKESEEDDRGGFSE
ncbi:MAG: stage 0 sporulation family protein [Oscillospiraceae bacterium]